MKTIIKVANAHGLGIYNYTTNGFKLVDDRAKTAVYFTKKNSVWIASADNATIVMPYLNRRCLEFAILAMRRADGFFFIGRTSGAHELTESEYHAIVNA